MNGTFSGGFSNATTYIGKYLPWEQSVVVIEDAVNLLTRSRLNTQTRNAPVSPTEGFSDEYGDLFIW